MKRIDFAWDEETGCYVPPSDADGIRQAAHFVVSRGSTADIKVYGKDGRFIATAVRPSINVYSWNISDPNRVWKKAVVEWLTGARPGRREPLRFRRWARQADGEWEKSLFLP